MYGWYHEHSRNWYIISDNLHKGSSPWIGNRWWQYQANSDSSHDMWTLFTRSLTRVYTHGFVTNVIQNGGAGVVIYFPNGSTDTVIEATRRHYSNYIDESDALMKAISLAVDSKPEGHHGCISHNCVLSSTSPDQQQFSTSSNALQLLCNYYNCRVALQWRLAQCRVALQWRLAHCRVE